MKFPRPPFVVVVIVVAAVAAAVVVVLFVVFCCCLFCFVCLCVCLIGRVWNLLNHFVCKKVHLLLFPEIASKPFLCRRVNLTLYANECRKWGQSLSRKDVLPPRPYIIVAWLARGKVTRSTDVDTDTTSSAGNLHGESPLDLNPLDLNLMVPP